MTQHVLAFGFPSGIEWIVVLVLALLVFGRRLPDVARSVGKSIVEFKRGIRDIESEVDTQSRLESSEPPAPKGEESETKKKVSSPPSDSSN